MREREKAKHQKRILTQKGCGLVGKAKTAPVTARRKSAVEGEGPVAESNATGKGAHS